MDAQLQHIAERELERGVAEHRAEGGTAHHHGPARPARCSRWPTHPTVDPNVVREYPDERSG